MRGDCRRPLTTRSAVSVEFGAHARRSSELADEPWRNAKASHRPSLGGLVGGAGRDRESTPVTYLPIAFRIRLAPSVIGSSVLGAAFKAPS